MIDRKLLTMALNYLQLPGAYAYIDGIKALREEIRARLAEPEPEPVAWITPKGSLSRHACFIDCAPLYRHPLRQPVRLTDEEILVIAEKYGTSNTSHRPTYYLHGSPTGETYPQTDWDFGQEDLLWFAQELMEKNQ